MNYRRYELILYSSGGEEGENNDDVLQHIKCLVCKHLGLLEFRNGEGNGTPLQYSCLENPMDGGAWWAAVHGVVKSWTQLSDFTFTFHVHALEKEMAIHSSVLAWWIPGTGEPDGLPSMGSHRVGHDWSDLAAAAAAEFRNRTIRIQHIFSMLIRWLGETDSFCCFLDVPTEIRAEVPWWVQLY